MSRDFVKNTSNVMDVGENILGPLLNGAAFFAVSAWVNYDTLSTTAGNNAICGICIDGANNGLLFSVHDGTSAVLRVAARSVTTDAAQTKLGTTAMSATTWYHVGAVIDIGGDTITPYVNGAAEGGGSVTFGNATWTQGTPTAGRNDRIGAGTATIGTLTVGQMWDGRIAELALWGGATSLSAGDMIALAAGVRPLRVNTSTLLAYWPLIGDASPERELRNRKEGTITGTIAAAVHPRMYYGQNSWTPFIAAGGPFPHYTRRTMRGGMITHSGGLL